MKKILCLLVVSFLMTGLVACTKNGVNEEKDDSIITGFVYHLSHDNYKEFVSLDAKSLTTFVSVSITSKESFLMENVVAKVSLELKNTVSKTTEYKDVFLNVKKQKTANVLYTEMANLEFIGFKVVTISGIVSNSANVKPIIYENQSNFRSFYKDYKSFKFENHLYVKSTININNQITITETMLQKSPFYFAKLSNGIGEVIENTSNNYKFYQIDQLIIDSQRYETYQHIDTKETINEDVYINNTMFSFESFGASWDYEIDGLSYTTYLTAADIFKYFFDDNIDLKNELFLFLFDEDLYPVKVSFNSGISFLLEMEKSGMIFDVSHEFSDQNKKVSTQDLLEIGTKNQESLGRMLEVGKLNADIFVQRTSDLYYRVKLEPGTYEISYPSHISFKLLSQSTTINPTSKITVGNLITETLLVTQNEVHYLKLRANAETNLITITINKK